MNYYSLCECLKSIGKTEQMLENWKKKNTLKPHYITNSG